MKRSLIVLLALLNSLFTTAQEGPIPDTELAKYPTYRTLRRLPVDSVYKISLENPGELPGDFDKYTKLQRLRVFGNDWDYDFRSLPAGLFKLENLTHIYISNTDLGTISAGIKNLKHLAFLDIADNNLISLPKSMSECEDLSELIVDNNIREIPPIPSLEELTIYFQTNQGDDSGTIPDGIAKLESCRKLNIYSEDTKINLDKMLAIILDMQVIESISFIDPQLTTQHISKLSVLRNIKELNLPSILVSPDVFSKFDNLKKISFGKYLNNDTAIRNMFWTEILSRPKLEEVSTIFYPYDTIFYKRLPRVNLRLNLDQTYPEQFEMLKNLPTLYQMTFPTTSNIPLSLRSLRTVKVIDFTAVNSQDFSFVFALLWEIPSLEKIIISNDQFTAFPAETAKLIQVKEMEIYNIQHGAFDAIPEKEKRRAEKMLPTCRFIYHE